MDNYQKLIAKVERVTEKHELDLSSGEDLSVGIMNLIGIEEHLFFTAQKTKNKKYLDLLNEVRLMRTELMKKIIKGYEGEIWCISKHLLAASMRLIEVGTKELKKAYGPEPVEGAKEEAWDLFGKAYKLYNLFWGINLKVIKVGEIDTEREKKEDRSVFAKLGDLIKKAVNCCKE